MDNHQYGEIGFSEEQADLLEVATNFCRDKSPMEKVRQLMETDIGFDQSLWQEIVDLGWLGIAIPDRFDGGVGLGLAEVVPVVEQMGRTMMATPFVSVTLAAQIILAAGNEAQQKLHLPKICAGSITSCALMEQEGSWDLMQIRAKASGESEITLSGIKTLVCDGAVADMLIVSVMRDGLPALVLLEKEKFTDRLRRETLIDETKRSYVLTLDGIRVLERDFLDVDRVSSALSHYQMCANLLSSAECCGGAQSVIDYTLEYLKTRKQFGKHIGSYQALKHPIVDAFVEYEQSRSHLYSAAHSFGEQGTGEIATRMAKIQTDKALTFASDRSIQFHGGFGFTYDCDAQLYRRRAVWHAAMYGDGVYHRSKLGDLLF